MTISCGRSKIDRARGAPEILGAGLEPGTKISPREWVQAMLLQSSNSILCSIRLFSHEVHYIV